MADGNLFSPPQASLAIAGSDNEGLKALPFDKIKSMYFGSHVVVIYAAFLGLMAIGAVQAVCIAGSSADLWLPLYAMVPLTLLNVVAMVGAWVRTKWGWYAGAATCLISMTNFPIGTIAGIFGMVAHVQAKPMYWDHGLRHKDVVAEYRARKAAMEDPGNDARA